MRVEPLRAISGENGPLLVRVGQRLPRSSGVWGADGKEELLRDQHNRDYVDSPGICSDPLPSVNYRNIVTGNAVIEVWDVVLPHRGAAGER